VISNFIAGRPRKRMTTVVPTANGPSSSALAIAGFQSGHRSAFSHSPQRAVGSAAISRLAGGLPAPHVSGGT